MRVNQGQKTGDRRLYAFSQEFRCAGDRLLRRRPNLAYAARTRNGFTPASCAELFKKIKALEIAECPFANLPEKKAGRWGAGLTVAKMEECHWLRPRIVGQFEFVEWTEKCQLRRA
jgi:bifunctional non-homologous end joining protein LigD